MSDLIDDMAMRVMSLAELAEVFADDTDSRFIGGDLVRRRIRDIAAPREDFVRQDPVIRAAVPFVAAVGREHLAGVLNTALSWGDFLGTHANPLSVEVVVRDLRAIVHGESVAIPELFRTEPWPVAP